MKVDKINNVPAPAELSPDGKPYFRAKDGTPCVYDDGPSCLCDWECPGVAEVWVARSEKYVSSLMLNDLKEALESEAENE